MKKRELNISLEEYLEEDPEITRYLSKENDDFWNNKLKLSDQIIVDDLVAKDPTAVIVGKDKEIRTGKMVNYLGAQIELQREMRFADLFTLLLEIDYLKKNGFRSQIEKVELSMENSPDYDWESDYQKVIKELEDKKKYNRKKILKGVFKNLEKILMEAEVDYASIADKLRSELPTPPIFYLEGPMGSGKSFIQRRLMLSYMKLAKEVGIKGFDILAIRDPLDPDRPKIIKLLGGEGVKLTTYYDNLIRKRNKIKKWKEKVVFGGILAFPVYFAMRIGLKLASYSWGLGIGVDPLADIGMWVNQNGDWIRWISYISVGYKFVSSYIDNTSKSKSKRPEWLSNSKSIPPVYVGSVGRENLEGEFKENTDLPPQSWLRGSSMMASDGKVAIIEQLPELTPDEQSWLSQLIQEREISVGNKGEYTIDIFPLLYIGANPHLINRIDQPLMDRLQLGASCFVTNEIERNTRTERKLFMFLEYHRKAKGGKPFTKEAMDALLEISSKLAEDKNQIEISRRYLMILENVMDLAKKDNSKYVTKEHAVQGLANTQSIREQDIEVKIQEHYNASNIETESKKVGIVTLLGYLTDKYIIDHENKDIKKQLEEENGVGYLSQVSAKAKKMEEGKKGSLKIMMPEKFEAKKNYFQERLSLLLKDSVTLSDYEIVVDLSNVIEEDDTLLPAMYTAIVSAVEEKPVRQDIAVAANCDLEGNLTNVSKINKRIYTAPDNVNSVLVSDYDFAKKVNTKLPIGPKVLKESNLKKLYGVLTE